MPPTDPTDPSWRHAAAELAEELRGIIESLAVSDLGAHDLEEATALARGLRGRLRGPRRPRWYEGMDDLIEPEQALAYLDQSPIRGRLNPVAPPLNVQTRTLPDGSRRIVATGRLGIAYEGPPHGVHGGCLAACFDEVLGAAQGLSDQRGVTAILRVHYRDVTPIEENLRFESWIDHQRGRRLVARATCHAGETLTADAEGVFVTVDFREVQARMLGRNAGRREEP